VDPAFWLAINRETSHRCQTSIAYERLFRYNLAETNHPADINILIRVTIYSNNLTMLTHAEQMGWGVGENPQEETGWPGGGGKVEDKELPPLQLIGS
jgi:hypothetical protein